MNTDWFSWLAAWLATYALHSALLLLAAWALTRLPAFRAPRLAEVVWRTALFGGVLTAGLHVALGAPLWRAPIIERAAVEPAPIVVGLPPIGEVRPRIEVPTVPAVLLPAAPAAAELETGLQLPRPAWLLLLWPLGLLALLWRGHLSHRRLARALDGRRDVADARLHTLVGRLAQEAGVTRTVRLTASGPLASPVALGTRHLEICLPERALATLSSRHLEAMLAHEVAHLARHDPLWLRAYRLLATLLFFQPLNHLAVARLRDASEMLCDAWAASSRPRRVALAECLTIVADWIVAGTQPQGAPAMARKTSKLGDRVHALLEPETPGPGRARLGVLALAPLLLVMAFAPGLHAAASSPTPRPAAEEPNEALDPVTALDAELALLAEEVTELTALLEATQRPDLAARIAGHLTTLESRRDALLAALTAEGK